MPYEQTPENMSEGWTGEVREKEGGNGNLPCEGSGGITPQARARKTVFIYALTTPEGEIRYVGKTVIKLYRRLCQHYRAGKNTHKDAWIASLKKLGLKPKIIELERIENSDDSDWQEAERFWITYLRFLGCRLTNLVGGGIGGCSMPEDVRKRIGRGNKGKKRTPEQIEILRKSLIGRKLSAEHVVNMSKAVKGKPRGPYPRERCEKTAAALRGRKQPPRSKEHCAKLSASQIGKKVSPETRAKISASHKGKKHGPHSPERIAKAVAGMTEESRKKMSIASLRRWGKIPPTPSA